MKKIKWVNGKIYEYSLTDGLDIYSINCQPVTVICFEIGRGNIAILLDDSEIEIQSDLKHLN